MAKKAAAKKAAAKDDSKKPAGFRPSPSTESKESKLARLDVVTANINKKAGYAAVKEAHETEALYTLRRPTGITSLDIALAGGFPASAPSVIVGPDGAGKDFLLWTIAAQTQEIYGKDFAMACYFTEFLPDKKYMKDKCGLKIGMSEKELDEEDHARAQAGRPLMTAEERAHYAEQVGRFYVIAGVTAEEGFDSILDYIKSNACQIVAVNSIGFLQTEAKDEQETFKDFAQRSSEAILISKFLPNLAMTLNRDVSLHERNETTVLLINQVRANDAPPRTVPGRPQLDKDKYKPASAAWSLKHGKAIELTIHNGGVHFDEDTKKVVGRAKNWEITKGKLGTHENIRGSFDYFYDEGVDLISDLIECCKVLGIFEVAGSWISYTSPDKKYVIPNTNGDTRMRRELLNSMEFYEHLRARCFDAAGVVYRHR